jgi:hypothetical protein
MHRRKKKAEPCPRPRSGDKTRVFLQQKPATASGVDDDRRGLQLRAASTCRLPTRAAGVPDLPADALQRGGPRLGDRSVAAGAVEPAR